MIERLPALALSINQPWAGLIVSGHKDLENRNWTTEFRGEFLIHAGLKVDRDCAEDLAQGCHPVTGQPAVFDTSTGFDAGGLVGIAELYGVVTLRTGGEGNPWFVGRYGFLIRNARPIEFIPCVGALSFFKPDLTRQYAPKPPRKERPAKPAKPAPPPQGALFDD